MSKQLLVPTPKKYIIKMHSTIGAADARDDSAYLSESFVDTGELQILKDMDDPRCIIVGRTGAGKTALLEELKRQKELFIYLDPTTLALSRVSDSKILRQYSQLGANMDNFYKLLWRHIFVIEIIKKHYKIDNINKRNSFVNELKSKTFDNKSKQDARNYIIQWSDSFWKETEHRTIELTKTVEEKLSGKLGFTLPPASLLGATGSVEKEKSISEQEKSKFVVGSEEIVDQQLIKTLADVMTLLEEDLLKDKKKLYYIGIDKLDEGWVDDTFKNELIRAMLETVRDFNSRFSNVKIVLALRKDLIDRIYRTGFTPGYQREKIESLYLNLTWHEDDLQNMLGIRLERYFAKIYSSHEAPTLKQIFTDKKIDDKSPIDYLLERTMLRPRDAILFFNECMRVAAGTSKINNIDLKNAEKNYSEGRLESLRTEWGTDYKNLVEVINLFKKYPRNFQWALITKNRITLETGLLSIAADAENNTEKQDVIYNLINDKLLKPNVQPPDFEGLMSKLLEMLFNVSFIGAKTLNYEGIRWSYQMQKWITAETDPLITFTIHPMFWNVLGLESP